MVARHEVGHALVSTGERQPREGQEAAGCVALPFPDPLASARHAAALSRRLNASAQSAAHPALHPLAYSLFPRLVLQLCPRCCPAPTAWSRS